MCTFLIAITEKWKAGWVHNGNLFYLPTDLKISIPLKRKTCNSLQSIYSDITNPIPQQFLMELLKIILSSQVMVMAGFHWPRYYSIMWLLPTPNFISYYATKFFFSCHSKRPLRSSRAFVLAIPPIFPLILQKFTTLLGARSVQMLPFQKTFYTKYF